MIEPKLIFLNISQVLPVHRTMKQACHLGNWTAWKVKGDTPGKAKGDRPSCEKVVGNRA